MKCPYCYEEHEESINGMCAECFESLKLKLSKDVEDEE